MVSRSAFQHDSNKRFAFLGDFFKDPFVTVDSAVCERADFWESLMEVSLPRVSHLKAMLKVGVVLLMILLL